MERMDMTHPEMTDLDETAAAVIHGVVPMAEIADFFDRAFSELATVLDRQGVVPTGPAFARYAGPPGETAVGSMASGYVNAGNLGIPIATYALGNAADAESRAALDDQQVLFADIGFS